MRRRPRRGLRVVLGHSDRVARWLLYKGIARERFSSCSSRCYVPRVDSEDSRNETANERVIVALDFDRAEQALKLVTELGDAAGFYKVGLQLLTAEGPDLIRLLIARGKEVFLDLKLHEIPTSVSRAIAVAGSLGVGMVSVHALGGSAVLRAAVEAARPFPQLRVLALTVITSLDDAALVELGIQGSVEDQVLRLGRLAANAGCHGVVASPREARILRSVLPSTLLIVTPGAQLPEAAGSDHVRVATPRSAIEGGATHLVMGRSVTGAEDPGAAFAEICRQVELGLGDRSLVGRVG